MLSRRTLIKAAAAAIPVASVRPIAHGIQLIGRMSVRTLVVPATLSGVIRTVVAIPTVGGVAYLAEINEAKAAAPALLALIGLATAWGLPLISAFLRRDRGQTYIADERDTFHDQAGGEFGLVTPSARFGAPSERTDTGSVFRINAQNGRTSLENRVQAPYTDLSNNEAFFLQSVGGPLRELAPYTARIPAGEEAQRLYQQALSQTRSTTQGSAEYQRGFGNLQTSRLLVAGRNSDGTRGYLLSPHFG